MVSCEVCIAVKTPVFLMHSFLCHLLSLWWHPAYPSHSGSSFSSSSSSVSSPWPTCDLMKMYHGSWIAWPTVIPLCWCLRGSDYSVFLISKERLRMYIFLILKLTGRDTGDISCFLKKSTIYLHPDREMRGSVCGNCWYLQWPQCPQEQGCDKHLYPCSVPLLLCLLKAA